jgi:hypothetical protein
MGTSMQSSARAAPTVGPTGSPAEEAMQPSTHATMAPGNTGCSLREEEHEHAGHARDAEGMTQTHCDRT